LVGPKDYGKYTETNRILIETDTPSNHYSENAKRMQTHR
jgi:Tat protein secretion system quality control protein TatD with DNase activity